MKYMDGSEVRLGDQVKLGDDSGGEVLCSIDSNEYSKEHRKEQWGYLKKGVMIEFPTCGVIHFVELEEDLTLLARSSK